MAAPATESPPRTVEAALRQFLALQEERARQYHRFDSAFRQLLLDGKMEAYREVCESVTAEFNKVSRGVIAVEAALNGPLARPELGQGIRRVQLAERDKLTQVSEYQIARQRWQEHATVLRQASRGAALHGDGHGHDHEHGDEVNGHAHAHGAAVRPVQSVEAPPAYLWTDVAEALDADDGAVVPEAEDVEDAEASEVAMVAGFLRDARAAWQRVAETDEAIVDLVAELRAELADLVAEP